MGRWIAGAGHPRPAGKAAEERVAELLATTATPPAGMRGPRARQSHCRGFLAAAKRRSPAASTPVSQRMIGQVGKGRYGQAGKRLSRLAAQRTTAALDTASGVRDPGAADGTGTTQEAAQARARPDFRDRNPSRFLAAQRASPGAGDHMAMPPPSAGFPGWLAQLNRLARLAPLNGSLVRCRYRSRARCRSGSGHEAIRPADPGGRGRPDSWSADLDNGPRRAAGPDNGLC